MKWLAVAPVWSRAVDELALRRPCAPCPPLEAPFRPHLRFPNPIVEPSSKPSPSRRPRPTPSSSLSFPPLSETVAIISILLYHYNSSGNVRSFSRRAGPDLHPELLPFIIVFHDISRFFLLPPLRARQRGEAFPKPRWILIRQTSVSIRVAVRINFEGGEGGGRLKRMLVWLNPVRCVRMHKDAQWSSHDKIFRRFTRYGTAHGRRAWKRKNKKIIRFCWVQLTLIVQGNH